MTRVPVSVPTNWNESVYFNILFYFEETGPFYVNQAILDLKEIYLPASASQVELKVCSTIPIFHFVFWHRVSLPGTWGSQLGWAGRPSFCFCLPPHWDYKHRPLRLHFHVGAGSKLMQSPHGCVPSTSLWATHPASVTLKYVENTGLCCLIMN